MAEISEQLVEIRDPELRNILVRNEYGSKARRNNTSSTGFVDSFAEVQEDMLEFFFKYATPEQKEILLANSVMEPSVFDNPESHKSLLRSKAKFASDLMESQINQVPTVINRGRL